MTTKEYPLDYIQAFHLLTGEEPVELETDKELRCKRSGNVIWVNGVRWEIDDFLIAFKGDDFRIYEPPKPEKLEPVELCEEVRSICNLSNRDLYGLIIAQALRMAREEREAEEKGDGR
jgi:hypothetical protein